MRPSGLWTVAAAQLRQDWKLILPWVLLLPLLPATSVWGFDALFRDDPATLVAMNFSAGSNPAFSVLFGPAPDITTAEGFAVWRSFVLGSFFTALMAVLAVTRNARGQEDTGRAELVAAAPVGRNARLAAALLLAWGASVAVGVLAAGLAVVAGADPLPMVLLGGAYAGSGVVFAGVAAVASQLASFARGANILSVATLGAAYLLRAFADTSEAARDLLWWTPFGWVQKMEPVGDASAWPLWLCAAAGVALAGVAFVLQGRRDFGMGFIPPRSGPERGGFVATLPGLVVRQQRTAAISWIVGLTVMGAVMGLVASSLGEILLGSPQLAAIIAAQGLDAGDLSFQFLRTLLEIIALIAAVHGVQLGLRLVGEEQQGRLDPLLATPIRREGLLAWYAVAALVAPALALIGAGVAMAVANRANGGEAGVGAVVLQSLAAVPAVWILASLGLAFAGALPSLRSVAWFALVAVFVISMLGPMLRFPDAVMGLSPLWHVPDTSVGDSIAGPVLAMTALAAALLAVAFLGFRRRDIG